jgi:hypothetical protein
VQNLVERFLSKFEPCNDGCWVWRSCVSKNGYGQFYLQGRAQKAHRLSYQLFRGKIPKGLELDHTCHDFTVCAAGDLCPHRRCVNPWHLEPVTTAENAQRSRVIMGTGAAMINRSKTHCLRGHAYTEENTYSYMRRYGRMTRQCRICNHEREQARWRNRRSA